MKKLIVLFLLLTACGKDQNKTPEQIACSPQANSLYKGPITNPNLFGGTPYCLDQVNDCKMLISQDMECPKIAGQE